MSFTTPGTIEYRLVIAQVAIVGIAFVLLVANKLPMKWAENFYKFSNYLFFGWLIGGSIINWVITGNLGFIISYVYPYIAIPMLASSIMFGYKNWRELRQMKRAAEV